MARALMASITLTCGCAVDVGSPEYDEAVNGVESTRRLEAEDAALAGGTRARSDHPGASRNEYADFGGRGSSVEWRGIAAGRYRVRFRYAQGSGRHETRPCEVKAGGARVGTLQFNNTGRWRSWDDTPALAFELLSAGTIELTASTEDGGPNVDYLELTRLEGEPDPEPPSDDPPAPPGGPQPSLRVDLRPAGTDLRLASYNINHDRPFRPNLERLELGSAFERLIASVDADIWCLQEVENSSGLSERQKLDVLTEHRPSGERWYSAWDDRGIFFASRYPIVDSERIDSLVYATWIDLPSSVSSRDLVVIGMHLKGNKTPKARNAVRFIEDVRGGSFAGASIDRDVTVVVCGDFNTNPGGGSHREIDRVLTDISPIQLGTHDERGTIGSVRFDSNGRWISTPSNIIDFLFYGGPYSGSVTRSFVLNPAILGDRYLADNGLEWWDIATNGSQDRDRGRRGTSVHVDHLPQIADFNLR